LLSLPREHTLTATAPVGTCST